MSNGYAKATPDPNAIASAKVLGPSRSGRRFVIGAAITILAIWATLFVVFREWRARHRDLAAFGAREVASQVDPLAAIVPPEVNPRAWKNAVDDTRAMLETLTASGLLDRDAMVTLRADLKARVAGSTPETAVEDLTRLWDDMQARAGPILTGRSSRPPYCPPRPEILTRTPRR